MDNPLLDIDIIDRESYLPWDRIKAEHFLPALKAALKIAEQQLRGLKQNPEPPSFENTILEIDLIREKLDLISSLYYTMLKTASNDQYRLISETVSTLLREFNSSVLTDEIIFARVSTVYQEECLQKSPPVPDLNDPQRMKQCERYRYIEKTYRAFQRNGSRLSPSDKRLLMEIDKELSALGPRFSNNLAAAINAFELYLTEASEVEGIPEWLLREAANLAAKRGKPGGWIFTMQTSILVPILNNCKNSHTRERLQRAYASKAYNDDYDNQTIVRRILALRKQRAKLLGYKNHVQYVLEERMLSSASEVNDFLAKVRQLAFPAAKKEYQEVIDFARELDGVTDFMFWDFNYYSARLREQKFQAGLEDLRPWFGLEQVLQGFQILAQKVFGVRFDKVEHPSVYHPDLMCYEAWDQSGKYLGLLYLDLFAREHKRTGTWTSDLVSQGYHRSGMKRPVVLSAINLVSPGEDEPMLLSLDEVRVLYIEFGHALHLLLSDCHFAEMSGNNVLRDFLEYPSQLLTRWLYEKEFLDLFARHYQTGEPLPHSLLEAVMAQKEYLKSIEIMGFLRFSALDLALHTARPDQLEKLNKFENKVIEPYKLAISTSDDSNITCQFGHIFNGGYAASFYTYLWSESLVADTWEYLKSQGIFNPEIGSKLRNTVFSKGNSVHPMELYMAFRGKAPDPDALLKPTL